MHHYIQIKSWMDLNTIKDNMKKELRSKVFNKCNQKCAYCGNDLEYKDMQVDHFYPKAISHHSGRRYPSGFYDENKKSVNVLLPVNFDSFENLMPACRKCNHYKRAKMPDEFRAALMLLHETVSKMYMPSLAIKYGIIEIIKPFDGDFYFKKQAKILAEI